MDQSLYYVKETNPFDQLVIVAELARILNPGVIEGMKDIAVDNKGNLYAVSRYLGQIFKIVGIDKVELVAGSKKGTGLRGNGIIAKEAELFEPIAIDFDLSGRLYIAETGKGLVRYIEDDGLLYTMAGGGFSWDGARILQIH